MTRSGWMLLIMMAGCGTTTAVAPPPRARVAEVSAQWRAAWDLWLAGGHDAALVTAKLLPLVDRVALTAADLAAVRHLPEVAEEVAARLGDEAALADARARLGARYVVDVGTPRAIKAGWLSGHERYRLTVPAGHVEVRTDASFVIVHAGETHTFDRSKALLPQTIRVATEAGDLELHTSRDARLRLLVHDVAIAPIEGRDVDGFDRAVADGDIDRADAAIQSIPREVAWKAVVKDAERRFSAIDATRPAELLDAPEPVTLDVAALPTSCLAREAWLIEHNEALRYRPDEVADVAARLPAIVGPCVRAALQAGDLLVDTFQLAAAEALALRLIDALDRGPEIDAAEALLARIARSRGVAPTRPVAAARALDLGLPLLDGAGLVASVTTLPPGQTVLLDDRFVHVSELARVTIRAHVIACAGDAAATEALGELAVPDDAEVVLARTWRRSEASSPQALEPEDIVQKDTISLPALLPGDCAEWVWYRELHADPRLPRGGFLLEPFTFERADATTVHARFRLRADPGVEPIFAVSPKASASRPDARTWQFEARSSTPRVPEPLDPKPEHRLAQVVAWGGFERDAWIAELRADVAPNLRATPSVRRVAARATIAERPYDRLVALHEAVVAAIEQASENPRAANASWAAARGRGERAMVLVAACAAVALPCDLVLARPLSEGSSDLGAPDPDAFVYPLVRARVGPEAMWLDPSNPWLAPGLIPPLVQDAPALVLSDAPEQTPLVLTPRLAEQGRRKVTIRGALAADGRRVDFSGAERLDGVYAASWRQALEQLAPEMRTRLLGAIVQQLLPGAVIDELTIDLSERYSLAWQWRAHASTESAGGVHRAVKLALLPEALARGTVQLPTRATPLLVNRSAALDLDVAFELPAGWLFVRSPQADVKVVHPQLQLARKTTLVQDTERAATPARLTIHKTFALAPAVIAPESYGAWKDAASEVDRADYLLIVVAPLKLP